MLPIKEFEEEFNFWAYKIGLELGFIKKVNPGLRTRIKCKRK